MTDIKEKTQEPPKLDSFLQLTKEGTDQIIELLDFVRQCGNIKQAKTSINLIDSLEENRKQIAEQVEKLQIAKDEKPEEAEEVEEQKEAG